MARRLQKRRSTLVNPYQNIVRDESPPLKDELPSCCNSSVGHQNCWWEPSPTKCHSMEFCRVTSLHGMKYIGEISTHFLERVFWAVAFALGIAASIYLTWDVLNKFFFSPVTVSFSQDVIDVGAVPFPAVTICNINNVRKSVVEELFNIAENGTKMGKSKKEIHEALDRLSYVEQVCQGTSTSFSSKFGFQDGDQELHSKLEQLKTNVNYEFKQGNSGLTIYKFLQEERAAQPCSSLIYICLLRSLQVDCSRIFTPVLTDFGKCCSFNIIPMEMLYNDIEIKLDEDDTSHNANYLRLWVSNKHLDMDHLILAEREERAKRQGFPFRVETAGKSNGLTVLLSPELNNHFCTAADSIGFQISVHIPIEFPHVGRYGEAIGIDTETFVKVKTDVTRANSNIWPLSQETRNCYFAGEYSLKYFLPYTAKNCYDECVANITFDNCRCLRYYMPKANDRRVCNHEQRPCAEKVQNQIAPNGSHMDLKELCRHCLPSCNSVTYISEITSRPLRSDINIWDGQTISGSDTSTWYGKNLSLLHVYFGEDSTYPKIRERIFGPTELLAAVGSLLGLCLGFSALSAVELLYFILRKVFGAFTRRIRLKQRWTKYQERNKVIELSARQGIVGGYGHYGYIPDQGVLAHAIGQERLILRPPSYSQELLPSFPTRNPNLMYYYQNYQ